MGILQAYFNTQVNVQRRPSNPARNELNEPIYNAYSTWPVVYPNLWTRIEIPDLTLAFNEMGDRIILPASTASGVNMYAEYYTTILPEDIVTVVSSNDANFQGQVFVALTVFPNWGALGLVDHYIITLQTI